MHAHEALVVWVNCVGVDGAAAAAIGIAVVNGLATEAAVALDGHASDGRGACCTLVTRQQRLRGQWAGPGQGVT